MSPFISKKRLDHLVKAESDYYHFISEAGDPSWSKDRDFREYVMSFDKNQKEDERDLYSIQTKGAPK